MAGYIGSGASVVSSGAENKKVFDITTNTTSLTGLNYTVGKVHVYHNGVRLVDGTDYTANNSTSITLTVAAVSGDQVVVVSFASYQVALSGIDDQSNAVAMTIDSNENIGIGTSSPTNYANYSTLTLNDTNGGVLEFKKGNTQVSRISNASDQALQFVTNGSERMRVDASGRVTTPYQPAFLAHGNNANYVSVTTLGIGSYIPFTNVQLNIGNCYNSSTKRFTAPVAGTYQFNVSAYTRTGTATEDIYTRWRVNGSVNIGYTYFYNTTGTEVHHTITDSITIFLNVGDDMGVVVLGNANADLYTGYQECRFSGYLIG